MTNSSLVDSTTSRERQPTVPQDDRAPDAATQRRFQRFDGSVRPTNRKHPIADTKIPDRVSYVWLALATTVLVLNFALQGVFPMPAPFYYLAVFLTGVLVIVPYLNDRVFARRLGGML